jgi:hypothetical protein
MDDIYSTQKLLSGSALKCDSEVQTPAEYINTDLPPADYEWNEWTMRRKALQMADLTNKRTHSTQTEKSHFRRTSETQTYKPQYAFSLLLIIVLV